MRKNCERDSAQLDDMRKKDALVVTCSELETFEVLVASGV